MTWIDEDDRLRDLPALIVAVMIHAALLGNGPLRWGSQQTLKPGPKLVAVEVVDALPKPAAPPPPVTTAIAPVPPAPKEGTAAAKKGPGPVEAEKRRKPKDAVMAAMRAQTGLKRPQALKKRPAINRMSEEQRRALALNRARQQMKAQALARRRVQAAMVREEQLRQARRRALELAEVRAEQARVAAEEARARAQAAAAARAEKLRLEAERRAELARRAAEARAAKAAQRAELKAALASMREPDEALADAPADIGAAVAGEIAGSPRGRGSLEAVVPQGDAEDVARLEGGAEPVYEMEREGFDPIDSDAAGGGEGPDGGGIGWSIDGPAGSRRIVKRALPESPAWVAQRGLDLSVQIKFQIAPDGRVKPGAVIKRTSGFPEIDRKALEAIRKWRFEPVLGRPNAGDAWGNVTFKFLMG